MRQIFKNIEARRLKPDGANNTVAAGTGDSLVSTSVDTQLYQSISFAALFGAIVASAVITFKLQHSNDDGVSDAYTDIAGSAQTIPVADAGKMLLSSIYSPQKRYVRVVITRATANATVDSLLVLLGLPANAPVAFGATVSGTPEFFNSPASGAA